jgi:hypothetical protein
LLIVQAGIVVVLIALPSRTSIAEPKDHNSIRRASHNPIRRCEGHGLNRGTEIDHLVPASSPVDELPNTHCAVVTA